MRETCSVAFAVQGSDAETGTFKGMASVFGNLIDSWMPTRISPGAFTKTLQENAKRIKILYQHDPSLPIGKPTLLKENSDGLYFEAKISQTTLGKDCIVLMKDEVITEVSIGFDPMKHETVVEDGIGPVRHIREVRLWEISPVTFAADNKAKISSIHSLTSLLAVKPEEFQPEMLARIKQHFGIPTVEERILTADEILAEAMALNLERFEGKVLSGKNRELINSAIEALNKILDAAEPKSDTVDSSLTVAFARHKVMELELALRAR